MHMILEFVKVFLKMFIYLNLGTGFFPIVIIALLILNYIFGIDVIAILSEKWGAK